ncbi:hypothetical protein WR25_16201 [Diploscapter pachys]|uniref:Uncharacterized protein n=1 Tax=Diploscapter pachys TaxID=2018661 RepID=A0A2A2KHB4_9BILA|nr:hypothetical protein WR25_16201 [Diploscapter pachys]
MGRVSGVLGDGGLPSRCAGRKSVLAGYRQSGTGQTLLRCGATIDLHRLLQEGLTLAWIEFTQQPVDLGLIVTLAAPLQLQALWPAAIAGQAGGRLRIVGGIQGGHARDCLQGLAVGRAGIVGRAPVGDGQRRWSKTLLEAGLEQGAGGLGDLVGRQISGVVQRQAILRHRVAEGDGFFQQRHGRGQRVRHGLALATELGVANGGAQRAGAIDLVVGLFQQGQCLAAGAMAATLMAGRKRRGGWDGHGSYAVASGKSGATTAYSIHPHPFPESPAYGHQTSLIGATLRRACLSWASPSLAVITLAKSPGRPVPDADPVHRPEPRPVPPGPAS